MWLIAYREFCSALRSPRTFVLMGAYAAVMSLATMDAYHNLLPTLRASSNVIPAMSPYGVPEGAISPTAFARLGRELFGLFSALQLVLVGLLVPPLVAGAFIREREHGALQMLLLTPIAPHHIVLGKVAGTLCIVALLVLTSLPVSSISFMLGGVAPSELAGVYVGLLVAAGWLGIMASSACVRFRSNAAASLATYCVLLALPVIALLVGIMLPGLILLVTALLVLMPLQLTRRRRNPRPPNLDAPPQPSPWADFGYVLSVPATLFCSPAVKIAVEGLSSFAERPPSTRRVLREWWERWEHSFASEKQPAHRRRQKAFSVEALIPDNANPVLHREIRSSLFGKKDMLIRALYVSTILTEVGLIALAGMLNVFDEVAAFLFGLYGVMFLGAAMVFGGLLGAAMIAPERERGTLDLMRTTPLSAKEILRGKLLGGFYHLSFLFIGAAPVLLFAVAVQIVSVEFAVALTLLALVAGVASTLFATLCSSLCRTLRQATWWALAPVLVLGGMTLMAETFGIQSFVVTLSPFGVFLDMVAGRINASPLYGPMGFPGELWLNVAIYMTATLAMAEASFTACRRSTRKILG